MQVLINRLDLTFEWFHVDREYDADSAFELLENGTITTLGHFFENATILTKHFDFTAPFYFVSFFELKAFLGEEKWSGNEGI
jgi:hypothetical protein